MPATTFRAMRKLLFAASLVLAAAPLRAQEDSTARRDSILERERRRIRGEAGSRVATDGAGDEVVPERRRTIALAAGLVGGGTWLDVEGTIGTSMQTGIGPRVGAEVSWPSFTRADFVVSARVVRAAARANDYDLAGDPGAVTTLDLLGGIDWVVSERARVRAAAGGAWVHGPEDIDPWKRDAAIAPAIDLSGALRIGGDSRWWLAAGVQAMRYSGVSTSASSEAGMVMRPWLEVRRAF